MIMIHQFNKITSFFFILVKMSDSEDSDDEFKELFDVFDQVRVQRTVGINYFGVKKDFFVQEKVR